MARAARSFSLRRTLAVRFSLTMFVGSLGLALWGYLGVRDALLRQLDQSLESSARLEVDALAAYGGLAGHKSAGLSHFIKDVNRFVAIHDSAGQILTSNTALAYDLPLERTAFERSREGRHTLITQQWHGHGVRSIYLPVSRMARTEAALVRVGASLIPLEASLHTVLLQLLGTVLLVTLATALGAGWLAASAVAPVHQITAQARAITGEVASQRITANADVLELRGLTEVLNDMLARLERTSTWHRRIVRDLGHDLRTPITAMRAGVEVALWSVRGPDEYRRVLASTLEEIDRLGLISDALVFLGRLEAGEVTLNRSELDVHAVARQVVSRAQEEVVAHTINLVQPPQPVLIWADARLLTMVVEQLLDNARRHTPPGTRIDITVTAQGANAVLTVEDDGPGVTDEVLPHLFERFYRSDTARGREGGPGLGLTAAASIIALHGGHVVGERGSVRGLRVTVTLARAGGSARCLSCLV